jgi:hypothetical protein
VLAEKTRATPEQTRRLPQLHAPGLYTVALVAVLGAILIVALAPRLDTDLWWHLKVGAYIAVHHAVPSHDFLSFTSRGRPWTDHEWLAELTLYSLYRLMGLWGPIVLFALVICAAFGLVYWQMAERGINRILALFLIFGGFLAASPAIGARPQMLSL